ncbi:hypothetical protein [Hyalangium minutum]|uniref:Lipoprotein n=1 Tax=Hyalangium minutum TaxID=394096 RepID=A0A085WMS1_9BACT|nr:hypothetical protein [Hyalangium minutum]KFE68984.1 hypothetical protein DB31_6886 [Hyalangium minutum]
MPAHRMMTLSVLVSLTACSYDFERSSEIRDRRILAVQIEPPEVAGGAPLPEAVLAQALVVDPANPLAAVEVSWRSCLRLPRAAADVGEAENTRCPEDENTVLLGSSSAALEAVSLGAPLPPELVGLLAAASDVPAPQLQVQVEVSSEPQPLVAVKQLTVTSRLPEGQEPNRNPVLQRVTLDGTDWLPDTPRTLKYGDCPDEEKKEAEADDGSRVLVCEHDVEPFFDEETQSQFYEERGFSGEPELQREILRFAWFTDAGSFRRNNTRQFDPRDPSPDNVGPQNNWREPATKTERATLWLIVRDGRGGTSWLRREVIFE